MQSVVRTLLLAAALTLATTASAEAKLWRVDDDRAQCPTAQFTTVQAAVDAAGPGDDIVVCNGTYPEDVVISGDKGGLRLRADVVHGATVRSFLAFNVEH